MAHLPGAAVAVVFMLFGQALLAQSSKAPATLPDSEATDAYLVYSALIKNTVGTRESSKVLIMDHTNGGPVNASCLKAPDGKDAAQYADQILKFRERNKTSYRLIARFDLGRPYELASTAPRFGPGRAVPPHFSMSAVGFNTARDRAVVYMEYGGMGGAYFLTKVDGRWTVDSQRMPFVCGWIA